MTLSCLTSTSRSNASLSFGGLSKNPQPDSKLVVIYSENDPIYGAQAVHLSDDHLKIMLRLHALSGSESIFMKLKDIGVQPDENDKVWRTFKLLMGQISDLLRKYPNNVD
jgi:hypothetical protein